MVFKQLLGEVVQLVEVVQIKEQLVNYNDFIDKDDVLLND
jgi:hypothetical protein